MKLINAFVLSALILFSAYANAESTNAATSVPTTKWALDSKESLVNFISIKKGNIAESHTFSDVTGHLRKGKALVVIKPDSVDSRVPIRDERMREFLFETGVYPTIKISADVGDAITSLKAGDSTLTTIPAILELHGISKELSLVIRISKLDVNTLVVASTQSVLIRAADFKMVDGIKKLSSLVNNLPIAESVPVNFSLQFKRD